MCIRDSNNIHICIAPYGRNFRGAIIETTAPIWTKFLWKLTKTTKYFSWVARTDMQDGGRPQAWIIEKRLDPSAQNLARCRILALRVVWTVKISNFDNPRWRTAAILKHRQTAISWQRFNRSASAMWVDSQWLRKCVRPSQTTVRLSDYIFH